jgi:hypothetical protein
MTYSEVDIQFNALLTSSLEGGECSIQYSKLLLALASTVILVSESHATHDRILLSDPSESHYTLAYSMNS